MNKFFFKSCGSHRYEKRYHKQKNDNRYWEKIYRCKIANNEMVISWSICSIKFFEGRYFKEASVTARTVGLIYIAKIRRYKIIL